MKTIRIKPRKGVELAGIPAAGADVPLELGNEWIAARLATEVVSGRVHAVVSSKPNPARTRASRPVATGQEEG